MVKSNMDEDMEPQPDTVNRYLPAPPVKLFPITRHFSWRLSRLLLRFPVTPNQITIASMITGIAGAACFLPGTWSWGICGALLLVLAFTLDNCDGEVARAKRLYSPLGAKLDDVSDSLVDGCFFLALGIGTTRAGGEMLWTWLGLATVGGTIIDYFLTLYREARADKTTDVRHEQASNPKQPANTLDWIVFLFQEMSHAEFCNIILVLALFDMTWILLPLGAVGAQVYWIMALFPRARGWHV